MEKKYAKYKNNSMKDVREVADTSFAERKFQVWKGH